jgi:hypothetical protein
MSVAAALMAPLAAQATTIQRVVSPGGIEAWLVQDPSVPLIAFDFSFRGGANQDPVDKPGVATMTTALLDEGAGELDSKSFHERVEAKAIQVGFSANRDQTSASLRTLSANQDEAFELLRLALTSAHFDAVDIEQRGVQTVLATEVDAVDVDADGGGRPPPRPYGRRSGTRIDPDHHARTMITCGVFARDTLKIAIVGDIDAATAGNSSTRCSAAPVRAILPHPVVRPGAGQKISIDLDVPQSVLMLAARHCAQRPISLLRSWSSRARRRLVLLRLSRGARSHGLLFGVQHLGPARARRVRDGHRDPRRLHRRRLMLQSEIASAEDGPDGTRRAKSFPTGSYALRFTLRQDRQQLVQIQAMVSASLHRQAQRPGRGRHFGRREAGRQAVARRRHAGHGGRPVADHAGQRRLTGAPSGAGPSHGCLAVHR